MEGGNAGLLLLVPPEHLCWLPWAPLTHTFRPSDSFWSLLSLLSSLPLVKSSLVWSKTILVVCPYVSQGSPRKQCLWEIYSRGVITRNWLTRSLWKQLGKTHAECRPSGSAGRKPQGRSWCCSPQVKFLLLPGKSSWFSGAYSDHLDLKSTDYGH